MQQRLARFAAILVTVGFVVGVSPAAATEDKPDFPPDQLEQMVAPIALYPDPLLTNILMASTYPVEVVQADRWVKGNAKVKGAELDKAMAAQKWDESVKSLTRTPDVLDRMSQNLDWTSDLGDAFLGQQEDVIAAVQRMRKKASDNGALQTTKEQKVVVEKVVVHEVEKEVIKVVPADPQVVYVPTYSAPVVYGSAWSYPSYYYPPMYAYPPGYVATASLVSFGVGMAVGAAVWGNCNWGGGWSGCCGGWGNNDIDIDRNVNIGGDVNVGRGAGSNRGGNNMNRWQHNPEHRRGAGYRNQNVSQKYQGREGSRQREMSRQQARGYEKQGSLGGDRTGGQRGQQARAGGGQARAGAGNRPHGQQMRAGGDRGSRPSSASHSRGNAGAFGGGERGNFERAASQRGSASRGGYGGSKSRSGGGRDFGHSSHGGRGGGSSYGGSRGGGGSRSFSGGGGHRGGGGGHRGGGGGHRGGGGRGGGGRRR